MTCSFRPYEGNEKYIFVSYAHVDGDIVYPIIERLHDAGFRIWFDEGIEWGSEWSESIAKHLRLCEVCIAFHSNASLDSMNCRQEVNYALKKRRSILSVYLEDVELSDGLDMQLSSYQSTFWFQYQDKELFFERLMEKTPILAPCREESASEISVSVEVHEEAAPAAYEVESEAETEAELEAETEAETEIEVEDINTEEEDEPEAEVNIEPETTAEEAEIEAAKEAELKAAEEAELVNRRLISQSCQPYREMSRDFQKSGEERENNGDLIGAKKWFEKCLEIRERIAGETGEAGDRRELSQIYSKLGDICKARDRIPEAKGWYEKSVEIREKLVAELNSIEAYDDLAISYFKLAVVNYSSVNLVLLKKAESMWEILVDMCPDVTRYAVNLRTVRYHISKAESK